MFSLSSSTKRYINAVFNTVIRAGATFAAWFSLVLLSVLGNWMLSYFLRPLVGERVEFILQTMFGGFLVGLAILILWLSVLDVSQLLRANMQSNIDKE